LYGYIEAGTGEIRVGRAREEMWTRTVAVLYHGTSSFLSSSTSVSFSQTRTGNS